MPIVLSIAKTSFHIISFYFCSFMMPRYEGYCCRLTASFALGKYLSKDNNVTTLDVGKVSLQLVFIPKHEDTLVSTHHLHNFYPENGSRSCILALIMVD